MTKATLLLFAISFSTPAYSVECGTYHFTGVVRASKKDGHQLVMKEKSHSEIKLQVPKENLMLFLSYLNKYISGEIEVDKNENISNPKNFKLTFPDPLVIEADSPFKLINKNNCKNN